MKLTKKSIDALKPTGSDVLLWDDEERFGLRMKPSGVKSYLIQYRNAQGQSKRLTIGQHGTWTPELARERARELLRMVDTGSDPAEKKLEDREAISVADLCREYAAKMDQGLILGRKGKAKKPHTVYTDKGVLPCRCWDHGRSRDGDSLAHAHSGPGS